MTAQNTSKQFEIINEIERLMPHWGPSADGEWPHSAVVQKALSERLHTLFQGLPQQSSVLRGRLRTRLEDIMRSTLARLCTHTPLAWRIVKTCDFFGELTSVTLQYNLPAQLENPRLTKFMILFGLHILNLENSNLL